MRSYNFNIVFFFNLTNQPFKVAGFRDEFLLTFRKFLSTDEFLVRLFDRLEKSNDPNFTLFRVVSILKTWFKECPSEWAKDSVLLKKLESLVESSSHKDYFTKYLISKMPTIDVNSNNSVSKGPLNLYRITTQNRVFKETHASVLAEQFSIIDKELYENIPIWELFIWATSNSSNKVVNAPNIAKFIDRYNETLNWVITTVVNEPSKSGRTEIISKFLELGKEAKEIRNFSLWMAIFESLSKTIIKKLPLSWEGVSDDLKKLYTSWIKDCDQEDNYESLRSLIDSTVQSHSCIPFLGGYIEEIQKIDSSSPDFISDKLLNFSKFRKMISIVYNVKKCDTSKYDLKSNNEVLDSIKRLHTITRDAMRIKFSEISEKKDDFSDDETPSKPDNSKENEEFPPPPPPTSENLTSIDSNVKIDKNYDSDEESLSISRIETDDYKWNYNEERDYDEVSFSIPVQAEEEGEVKRARIIRELLETEQRYVEFLTILVDHGIVPLRNEKILSDSEIRTVFSNVETILQFHRIFLEDLKKRIDSWNSESLISDIFAKYYQYFKLYFEFVNNFEASDSLLNRLLRRNTRLIKQQEKILQMTRKLDFPSLLIMPVQKVPRYVLLLKEYQKNTKTDHPDYKAVKETIENMESISSHINSSKRDSEQRAKAIQMNESRLIGYNRELLKPGRDLIDELELQLITPNDISKIVAIMWSDVIMLCKPKDGKKKLYYLGNIQPLLSTLSTITTKEAKSLIQDKMSKDLEKKMNWSKHNYLYSISTLGEQFILSFSNEKTYKRFLTLWEEQCTNYKGMKVYTSSVAPNGAECTAISLIGQHAYVFGGLALSGSNSYCVNEMWVLNTEDCKWQKLEVTGDHIPSLTEHTMVNYQNELYVFGGHNLGVFSNVLYKFSPSTNTWSVVETKGDIPSPRSGHSAVVSSDKMYIHGGYWFEHVMSPEYYNDIYVFDFKTSTWTKLETVEHFTCRKQHICELVENRIFIYGGITYKDTSLNDLIIHNLEDNTISKQLNVYGYIPTSRYAASSATYGNKIIFYGGSSNTSYMNDIYVLDTDTLKWTLCWTPYELPRRKNHTMFIDGNSIFIYGGKIVNNRKPVSNEVTVLNNLTTLVWKSSDYAERIRDLKKKSEKLMKYSVGTEDVNYHCVQKYETTPIPILSISNPTSEIALTEKTHEAVGYEVYKGLYSEASLSVSVIIIPIKNLIDEDPSKLINFIDCIKELSHSSFVRYFTSVVNDSDLWIIQENSDGKSIKDYLQSAQKPFSERQTAMICSSLLEVLSHLHRLDVIHGSLSSSNVLLCSDGTLKLNEYGLRQFLKPSLDPNNKDRSIEKERERYDTFSLGSLTIEMLENTHTLTLTSKKFSPDVFDFISVCLSPSYIKRPSALQLFTHPFVKNYMNQRRRLDTIKEIYDVLKPKRPVSRFSIMDLAPGKLIKDPSSHSLKSEDSNQKDSTLKCEIDNLKNEVDSLKKENEELRSIIKKMEERLTLLESKI